MSAAVNRLVFAHYGVRCNRCGDDDPQAIRIHHRQYAGGCETMAELEPVCFRCHRCCGPVGWQDQRHGSTNLRNDMWVELSPGKWLHPGHTEWSAEEWRWFVDEALSRTEGLVQPYRRDSILRNADALPHAGGVVVDHRGCDIPLTDVIRSNPDACRAWVAARRDGAASPDWYEFHRNIEEPLDRTATHLHPNLETI